jgi:hypothetical protein
MSRVQMFGIRPPRRDPLAGGLREKLDDLQRHPRAEAAKPAPRRGPQRLELEAACPRPRDGHRFAGGDPRTARQEGLSERTSETRPGLAGSEELLPALPQFLWTWLSFAALPLPQKVPSPLRSGPLPGRVP